MTDLELERRLSHVEDRAKSNSHRLDALETRQGEMAQLIKSVAAIAQKQADMDDDVREIKADVKGLLAAPSERWKTVVAAALTAVVGAVVGLLI